MNWNNRHVLVSGAGGFIGSHLVEAMLQEGARVRAFLRYTADRDLGHLKGLEKSWGKSLQLFFGDIRDFQSVESAVEGIDTIFHLAAIVSIPYSIAHPMEVYEVNALGTLHVLEAARKRANRIQRVVVTSSSEVYGSAQVSPMTEDHPKSPQSPYAASKISADALAQSYYRSYGLPVVVLRPFNTYGPRQSDRAVIPTIVSQALWRQHIELGDLRPQRDFTYVMDTVRGFILAGQRPGAIGQTIHLGTGRTVSVKQVVDLVQRLLGAKKRIRSNGTRWRPRRAEVIRLISNPALARRLLRWQPKVAFEEGLRQTIAWIRRNPELYHPDAYRI